MRAVRNRNGPIRFHSTTITTDEGDQNINGIPDSQEIDDPNLDLDANGYAGYCPGGYEGREIGY